MVRPICFGVEIPQGYCPIGADTIGSTCLGSCDKDWLLDLLHEYLPTSVAQECDHGYLRTAVSEADRPNVIYEVVLGGIPWVSGLSSRGSLSGKLT